MTTQPGTRGRPNARPAAPTPIEGGFRQRVAQLLLAGPPRVDRGHLAAAFLTPPPDLPASQIQPWLATGRKNLRDILREFARNDWIDRTPTTVTVTNRYWIQLVATNQTTPAQGAAAAEATRA